MQPFSENPAETIASLGEKELLKRVRLWLGDSAPVSPEGMGDDCAEIPATEKNRLITTDSVLLGRHFEARTPAGLVGEKLLKRNLSDIAAMGGTPTRAVMAALLPRRLRLDWLKEMATGMARTAREFNVLLVGGDMTESSVDLAINLTLLGTASQPLYRKGGKAGDLICVTGKLGGSLEGRHLDFMPRLPEGRALADEDSVHACIDISDGLAIDLINLLGENISAFLDTDAIPIHPDAEILSRKSGRTVLDHALNDGEDHELLFLVGENGFQKLQEKFRNNNLSEITCIGNLGTFSESLICDKKTGKPFLSLSGYDHFK